MYMKDFYILITEDNALEKWRTEFKKHFTKEVIQMYSLISHQ